MPNKFESTVAIIKTPLGDIPASGEMSWTIDDGTHPSMLRIPYPEEAENVFLDNMLALTPMTLELRDPYVPRAQQIDGLFYLRSEPHSTRPQWRFAVFADQRILWPRKHVLRFYNMRRVSGYWRITDPTAVELQQVEPDLWYWGWSLKDSVAGSATSGIPWTVGDIVRDLAAITDQWIKEIVPDWPTKLIPYIHINVDINRVVPQSLFFDDSLDVAWDKLLAYAPELKLYLDRSGKLVVERQSELATIKTLESIGPVIYGSGDIRVSWRGPERPKYIDVLFTNEHEVRFDYHEPNGLAATSGVVVPSQRRMDNVLQYPDFASFGWVQGDWVTFNDAMSLWSPSMAGLDWPMCRALICPYNDFATQFGIYGGDATKADIAGRLDAIQYHFRRTFRLPREWLEQSLQIEAARVAISSKETGQRAKPRVYTDYFRLYTRRHTLKTFNANHGWDYGANIIGYPTSAPDYPIDASTREAPVAVEIVNRDLGIIHLNYLIDPLRLDEKLIPGLIDGGSHPNGDLRQKERPVSWDAVIHSNQSVERVPAMKANYKMSLILLCVPANAPLHRVRVTPQEALGSEADRFDFSGAPMEVRINQNKEVARWAWRDDQADAISAKFGVSDGDANVSEELLLNASVLGAGAPLDEIARAVAQRVYWRLQDREMGSADFSRSGAVGPRGFIDSVTHRINRKGVLTTRISMEPELPELQLESMLSDGSRQLLMRQAIRGTGT